MIKCILVLFLNSFLFSFYIIFQISSIFFNNFIKTLDDFQNLIFFLKKSRRFSFSYLSSGSRTSNLILILSCNFSIVQILSNFFSPGLPDFRLFSESLDISCIRLNFSQKFFSLNHSFILQKALAFFTAVQTRSGKRTTPSSVKEMSSLESSQETGSRQVKMTLIQSCTEMFQKMMTKMLLELPESSTRKEPAKQNDRPLQSSPQHKGKEQEKPKHKDWIADQKFTPLDQKLETVLEISAHKRHGSFTKGYSIPRQSWADSENNFASFTVQ